MKGFAEITVRDIADLYIERSEPVTIWSSAECRNVFDGMFCEAARSVYADCIVESFGIEDGVICLNID